MSFSQRNLQAQLKTAQAATQPKFCKRATKPTHRDTETWTDNDTTEKKPEPPTAVWQKNGFSG